MTTCTLIVEEFEKEYKRKEEGNEIFLIIFVSTVLVISTSAKKANEEPKSAEKANENNKRKREEAKEEGEQEELKPVRILGATDETPGRVGLHFLIRFSNGKVKLVRREEAHRLYAHLLIDYYEKNTQWVEISN